VTKGSGFGVKGLRLRGSGFGVYLVPTSWHALTTTWHVSMPMARA